MYGVYWLWYTGSSGGSSGKGVGGLEELDISENPLDSKGTHMLANRLIRDFHNLKMLNLEKCNVDCPRLLTAIEQASKKGMIYDIILNSYAL